MQKEVIVKFSAKNIFLVAGSFILLALAYYLKDILVLFLLAFILATAIKPAIDWFQKKRVPRWLSILVIYSAIIFIIYTLVRLIIPPISEQVGQLMENRQLIAERFSGYLSRAPKGVHNSINDFTNSLPDRITKYTSGSVVGNVLGVFSGLLGMLTVFVITFYLLLDRKALENVVEDNWFWGSKDRVGQTFNKITQKVSLWLRGQLILSGAIGILTYVGLTILGVEFALTLALIAAVTELLPVVGPFIGAAFALFISVTASPLLALWVALLYFGIQQFEAQILVPQVMKKALGLSPITIIFALLVGGKLLGILGIVIAVPVAAAISVILEELKKKPDSNRGKE